jgi:hypothetical protein
MINRYGVDVSYFQTELEQLILSLDDRKPDELRNYLTKLAEIADTTKQKFNIHELEKFLISPDDWHMYYDNMPQQCQKIVDSNKEELGGSTGIGYHVKTGWFILGTGQGPFLIFSEK